jgi:two-component system alkaline phosphatase synthesis response regulator PhoP
VSDKGSGELVLVVEDERHLAEVIADNLELEGLRVERAHDGAAALEAIRRRMPALVLLDVMLPGLDGFEVCARLREEHNDVPILFLTAKSSGDDRVRGLELGGDDFLAKPFDLRELMLRVQAILRRRKWMSAPLEQGERVRLGRAVVDFKNLTARIEDREVPLSSREAMILRCLVERPGEIVSREEIVDRVWGYNAFPTLRTVDNFIVRLRRVCEEDPQNPRFIHTVRGRGYRLTP